MPKAKTKKKKIKREVSYGVVHIQSTFNNTIITIADQQGSTICWASSGTSGLKEPGKERLCCPAGRQRRGWQSQRIWRPLC